MPVQAMSDDLEIDLTKIEFPSDGMTIKQIRTLHPEQVDAKIDPSLFGGPHGSQDADNTVGLLLFTERLVAKRAFDDTLARKSDELFTLTEYADDLAEMYMRHGIASGSHHAQQLIRHIESQAAAQARTSSGRRP
jgi:hypothetical protein